MGRPVKGDIVVVLFPFFRSDQCEEAAGSCARGTRGDDLILCQITSRLVSDRYAIPVTAEDFASGSLRVESSVRPVRVFTTDRKIIQYTAIHLKEQCMNKILDRVTDIIRS